MKVSFEIIQIEWGKAVSIPKGNDRAFTLKAIESGKGIYAAYGDHDLYGRNVLLYIGKTVHFDVRTKQYLDGVLSKVNNLSLAYGRVSKHPFQDESEAIGIAEQILIAALKPAYNRQNIHALGSETLSRGFIIQNLEERGSLPLEVTNYWWLPDELKIQ